MTECKTVFASAIGSSVNPCCAAMKKRVAYTLFTILSMIFFTFIYLFLFKIKYHISIT